MTPDESNRILTGLIFLGVKAERLCSTQDKSQEQQLIDALRLMQQAAAEAQFLDTAQMPAANAHNTKESLLADAFVRLFGACHANNMQIGSAVLKRLTVLEHRFSNLHAQSKEF